MKACESCRYWAGRDGPPECRRYPPHIDVVHGKYAWPATNAKHWCGEWTPTVEHKQRVDDFQKSVNITRDW